LVSIEAYVEVLMAQESILKEMAVDALEYGD
jgi:hypothetical protein